MIKKYLLRILPLLFLLSCQERREAPAVLWGGEMHNSNAIHAGIHRRFA